MTNSISEINLLSGYQPVANEETRKKFEQAWGCILPSRPGITQVEMFYAADVGEIIGEGGTGDDFYAFPFPESLTNALTNDALDPIVKTPEYDVCAIRMEKIGR